MTAHELLQLCDGYIYTKLIYFTLYVTTKMLHARKKNKIFNRWNYHVWQMDKYSMQKYSKY